MVSGEWWNWTILQATELFEGESSTESNGWSSPTWHSDDNASHRMQIHLSEMSR